MAPQLVWEPKSQVINELDKFDSQLAHEIQGSTQWSFNQFLRVLLESAW